MTNIETAYYTVCRNEAEKRINLLVRKDTPKEIKEELIESMTNRLFNMYEDLFESNHMNAIAVDVIDELNKAHAKEKITEYDVMLTQGENPVAKIRISTNGNLSDVLKLISGGNIVAI